jgi:hypothetical protein
MVHLLAMIFILILAITFISLNWMHTSLYNIEINIYNLVEEIKKLNKG